MDLEAVIGALILLAIEAALGYVGFVKGAVVLGALPLAFAILQLVTSDRTQRV